MSERTIRPGAATMIDVARLAGVSTATVSRVLNGVATVDSALAERVRSAADEVRYVTNTTGRALRRQRIDTWAAVVADVENHFFTSMVAALENVAQVAGFSVMLCNSDEDVARERRYLQAAIAQRMSGVVIAVVSETDSSLQSLLDAGIPTVAVDRRVHDFAGDAILLDNVEAGRMAARHLLSQGYAAPLCIAGPRDVSTTEDRLAGFREVFAEEGVSVADSRVIRTELLGERAEGIVADQVEADPDVDAVFALNGPLTAASFRGIEAARRRIPGDVALLGVDDDHWTRMVNPRVSVVAQPVDRIGQLAGEVLAARTRGEERDAEHVLLAPELRIRASTSRRS
ncbi:transcriptional regulator, LacI family [Beutenbergia cavernae DSM 12333]|uniref:Transcriptional regulator, LacI family n=1 Tax=Beutenbergia cavernae (strain ATCC BAA-8 / DSM 12333 / CCUG 43141 / JCM 11478 / NBRC 16432 / NCIMB 13614 / HKI 0122) TaxID=471853 RepID=C5C439_BEUC1|nr:LacI family DNA-binding transcriptional regulator [Beutenbergia cavernae]ACQ79952.1 transcriptional regulator, LacI family [Beutenbergia cavernae DSM 12333]